MPLPIGSNAQETKELVQLYDRLAELAFIEQLRYYFSSDSPQGDLDHVANLVSENSYKFATAMLNERKK